MMKTTKSALLAASALALMLTAANAQEYGPGPYDDGSYAPPPTSDYGPGPYGNDDYGPPPADYGPPPGYDDGYGAPPENVIVIAPPYQTDHSSLAPTERPPGDAKHSIGAYMAGATPRGSCISNSPPSDGSSPMPPSST